MVKKDFKSTFLNIENEDENEKELQENIELTTKDDDKQLETNTSKKNSHIKNKTKIEKADKVENKEEIIIIKEKNKKPVVVKTTEVQVVAPTMNDIIQQKIVEVEKEIKNLKRVGFGTGKKKIPFDDMYGGKTISMNRYLKPLFEEICLSSSITRAEIIEQILINGIKNTNFNPPKEDE